MSYLGQVAVAEEKLPPEKLKEVLMACLQVLREIRDTYDALRSGYRDMGLESCVRPLMDSMRMVGANNISANSSTRSPASQESDREMLKAVLGGQEREYVEIASCSVIAGYVSCARPCRASFRPCSLRTGRRGMPPRSHSRYFGRYLPFTGRVARSSIFGQGGLEPGENVSEFYLAALVRSCGDPADSLFSTWRLPRVNAVKSAP